jgi:hypothetical protein
MRRVLFTKAGARPRVHAVAVTPSSRSGQLLLSQGGLSQYMVRGVMT